MLSFKFLGRHLKIGEFKIIHINTFIPIDNKGEGSFLAAHLAESQVAQLNMLGCSHTH